MGHCPCHSQIWELPPLFYQDPCLCPLQTLSQRTVRTSLYVCHPCLTGRLLGDRNHVYLVEVNACKMNCLLISHFVFTPLMPGWALMLTKYAHGRRECRCPTQVKWTYDIFQVCREHILLNARSPQQHNFAVTQEVQRTFFVSTFPRKMFYSIVVSYYQGCKSTPEIILLLVLFYHSIYIFSCKN